MGLVRTACEELAISVYVGSITLIACTSFACSFAVFLGYYRLPAIYFATLLLLIYIPLGTPSWAASFSRFAMASYSKRTKLRVVYEDPNTFTRERAYVVGYEPHSVFPFGLPQVFSDAGPYRANVKSLGLLATSVVNWCPVIRHLFHWLNGVSASRETMHSILNAGGSAVLVPGGVAECAYMEPGKDVVFLKSRKGFVKIALQHGAQLVPVYCFGQSNSYKFIRLWPSFLPQWMYDRLVRTMMVCPMLIYGMYGTPLARRQNLYMAIGKPIELPCVSDPEPEVVQKYLQEFISSMQGLFTRHQSKAGFPDSKLIVM